MIILGEINCARARQSEHPDYVQSIVPLPRAPFRMIQSSGSTLTDE
jgi:hypothetical protein